MRVRRFAVIGLLLAATGCERAAEAPRDDRPPPVILISIDTLRADHVGTYGYARPTTPALDRFARDAIVFEHCMAHAPTTLASHASILTSWLPIHHGASISGSRRLAAAAKPLAEVLREAGYRTASFNGGIQLHAAYGLDRGFDVYESALEVRANRETLSGPETTMAHAVDRALPWIDAGEGPFFLFLHSYEIHHPYDPDPEDLALFDGDYAGELPDAISVELLEAVSFQGRPLAPGDGDHIVAAYDAELHSVDRALGRFFDALRERDLYDRSLVIVTSDHGEEFGERGHWGWHSHTLYDELLMVPLIVKLPAGQAAGARYAPLVQGMDVAPTALAAARVAIPERWDGRNLLSVISSDESAARPAVAHYDAAEPGERFAVRTDRWKLHHGARSALFSLPVDPGEKRNLYAKESKRSGALERFGRTRLAARPRPETEPAPVAASLHDKLRALGYVE